MAVGNKDNTDTKVMYIVTNTHTHAKTYFINTIIRFSDSKEEQKQINKKNEVKKEIKKKKTKILN